MTTREHQPPSIYRQPPTKYFIGDRVFKHSGEYQGPGFVRGVLAHPDGRVRYIVGHTIAGGSGEFLHIYSESNIILDSEIKGSER